MFRATNAEPAESLDSGRSDTGTATAATTTPVNLDETVRAVLRGDSAALRQFLDAIAPLVRKVCRGVMGREHPELEDAIQDCLIDVVRALPQFRFEADISHYITKIVLRRSIVACKRARARHKHHPIMDLQDFPVVAFDDAIESRAHLVRNLLDQLSGAQATVLRLRLILGHSIGEIANITGVSVNTVKTRLRLGKTQLRQWLERSGEVPRGG